MTVRQEMPDDNRRQHGRRLQEGLYCDLGDVLDLSAGGMRVLTSKVPEGQFDVTIISSEGPLTVLARVAWTKRRGLARKREIGLQFLELGQEVSRALARISSSHRTVRT